MSWTPGMWSGERPWSKEPYLPDLDDDGLPPLADGSSWNEEGVDRNDGEGAWISVISGSGALTIELTNNTDSFSLTDIRHIIARHDRDNGEYWRDRMLLLADSMIDSAKWEESFAVSCALRDSAHRILAVLDEVPG